jgi:hypothetical protein
LGEGWIRLFSSRYGGFLERDYNKFPERPDRGGVDFSQLTISHNKNKISDFISSRFM